MPQMKTHYSVDDYLMWKYADFPEVIQARERRGEPEGGRHMWLKISSGSR